MAVHLVEAAATTMATVVAAVDTVAEVTAVAAAGKLFGICFKMFTCDDCDAHFSAFLRVHSAMVVVATAVAAVMTEVATMIAVDTAEEEGKNINS